MIDIANLIHEGITLVTSLTGNNQFLVAAIGAWAMGIGTYLLRNVPKNILETIKTQSTVSLTFNNYTSWESMYLFNSFSEWFTSSKWFKFSRTHSLEYTDCTNDEGLRTVIGPGYGKHFFFFKGKFYWFTKSQSDGNQSSKNKENINIHCFGRKKSNLFELIQEISPKPDEEEPKLKVFSGKLDEWEMLAETKHRSIDSVILKKEVKEEILKALDSYTNSKEWYAKTPIPYKMSFLFKGVPGTGKTSLVKAIASYLKRNIYIINLNNVSDNSLGTLIKNVPRNSIILVEDIDSFDAVRNREHEVENEGKDSGFFKKLTLSGILNVFDGVVGLDDVLIFMTTNHEDRIDDALRRKGRTDLEIEIPPWTTTEIKEYVKFIYDEDIDGEYKDTPGCEIQALVISNKMNFEGFKKDLDEKFKI